MPSALGRLPDIYMLAQTWSHARHVYSLNFSKLCNNFILKLVSEIRKCRQLQMNEVGRRYRLEGVGRITRTCKQNYHINLEYLGYIASVRARLGLYAVADVLLHSPCSLNIPNLCDNFVKNLVSEIKKKCRQLQGDPHWGSAPKPLLSNFSTPS